MFGRARSRGGLGVPRTVDQEKIVAQTFVKFLEDNNRKEDMYEHELKQIYRVEFSP